jgi:hypothetical protein
MTGTLPKQLLDAAADERVQLVHRLRYDDYGIRELEPGVAPRAVPVHSFGSCALIDFCPWTGMKLSEGVGDAFFRIVEDELGLKDFVPTRDDSALPLDMRSDAWWRKRSKEELDRLNVPQHPPRTPEPPEHNAGFIIDLDGAYQDAMALPPATLDGNRHVPPGFRRYRGWLPHFCLAMTGLGSPNLMLAYMPWTREYGIRILDPLHAPDYQPLRIRPISFCPWCGQALPKTLRSEWNERVRREVRVSNGGADDPEIDAAPPYRTPAYYCFDNWWRDAGL